MFAQNLFSRARSAGIGQAQALPDPTQMLPALPAQPTMQDLSTKLNTTLTQQAAQLQQAQDTASSLWWSMNWPYVAAGVGALGLVGYLLASKK